MKKTFLLLLSAMVLGCTPKEFIYVIVPADPIPQFNGQKIVFSRYSDGSDIGEAEVSDGGFVFRGKSDFKYYIRASLGHEYANFILEKDTIRIDFTNHVTVAGEDGINSIATKYYADLDSVYIRWSAEADSITSSEMKTEVRLERMKDLFGKYFPLICDIQLQYLKQHGGDGIAEQIMCEISTSQYDMEFWNEAKGYLCERIINESRMVRKLDIMFKALENSEIGSLVPDVGGVDPDGNPVRLHDYLNKGKYLLVDYWASWCGPCREEARTTLRPLYEKYRDNDRFQILGVTIYDDIEKSKKVMAEDGYDWPQILNKKEDCGFDYIESNLGVDGIPFIIVISPEGKILARNIRGAGITSFVDSLPIE